MTSFHVHPGLMNLRVTQTLYDFYAHEHPYVSELFDRLIEGSVSGLQGADTELTSAGIAAANSPPKPADYTFYAEYFDALYTPSALVGNRPVRNLDFSSSAAYGVYNWELFFHIPLMVAINLTKTQRFEEAQTWFHYIFDPTDDSGGATPARFWKVQPFQSTDVKNIEDVLVNLASGADPALQKQTQQSIAAWKDNPFQPHAIARARPWAYMTKTVTAYLDNLIGWGDSLFRQDAPESINEALNLDNSYVK